MSIHSPSNTVMYENFNKLAEIRKLRTFIENGITTYQIFLPTGDLNFSDYGRGYLCVNLYLYDRHSPEGKTQIRIVFLTADDGDFGGWGGFLEKDKAEDVLKTCVELFDSMYCLPSQEDLNSQLQPFGIQVNYE
jgi:hypothetical protein